MSLEDKIMIIYFFDLSFLWGLTASLMISLDVDGFHWKMTILDLCYRINGRKIWTRLKLRENIKEGESVRTSSVYTKKNGEESRKTVTSKKAYKDGKAQ